MRGSFRDGHYRIAVRVLDLVVLLSGPGRRLLSADIFFWTVSGRQEAASVLALVPTVLVMAGYAVATASRPCAAEREGRVRTWVRSQGRSR
jgi:hypothetical protein